MRNLRRALLAGALGFAVSLIAACGGGAGLLSANQASTLNSRLDQVSSDLSQGRCGAVPTATQGLANAILNLPATVSGTLRRDLDQAANQVTTLAVQQCHQATTAKTTPTNTTTTNTTTTNTTPTNTTTTNTTPTNTTTTNTTPATTPTNPGTTTGSSGGGGLPGGSGAGNGNGNGNGND
jgi:hypothetical protein